MQSTTEFGSIYDVPYLPDGFLNIFDSVLIDVGEIRIHAVVGGNGPPLLLLCGWPQCWYTWRDMMLPLAEKFTLVVPDPRGVGLSSKPKSGYDTATLGKDMFSLMDRLGHQRFAMVGHDIGMWTGYAMASENPGRIERIALGEAFIPGASPSPPLLVEDNSVSDLLWHFNFNRAQRINEQLVKGREELYFNYQFSSKSGSVDGVPDFAKAFYIEQLAKIPGALQSSFEFYRVLGLTISQNAERAKRKITMPVFTFAGELSCGNTVDAQMRLLADNVESLIIPNCGHYPSEEAPAELLDALAAFLEPYRNAEM